MRRVYRSRIETRVIWNQTICADTAEQAQSQALNYVKNSVPESEHSMIKVEQVDHCDLSFETVVNAKDLMLVKGFELWQSGGGFECMRLDQSSLGHGYALVTDEGDADYTGTSRMVDVGIYVDHEDDPVKMVTVSNDPDSIYAIARGYLNK